MAKKTEEMDNQSLEEMFQALDQIVSDLEGEDITLDQSFALYNQGMILLKECNQKIDKVEKKIKILDEDGKEQDF